MNAFEYLVLMAERQVVKRKDILTFVLPSNSDFYDLVFSAMSNDWEIIEGFNYVRVDECGVFDGTEFWVYDMAKLITAEDVRSFLESFAESYDLDKRKLVIS